LLIKTNDQWQKTEGVYVKKDDYWQKAKEIWMKNNDQWEKSKYGIVDTGGNFTSIGPSELIAGNEIYGYYGFVTSEEFISAENLIQEIGLNVSQIKSNLPRWMKFNSGGKIVFVPMENLVTSISWDALYSCGCVFGTDDNGPTGTSDSWGQGNIKQDARVTIKGYTFKVRLLTGSDQNPSSESGGEWDILIYGVHGSKSPNWAFLQNWNIDIGTGKGSLCQESGTDLSTRVARGGSQVATISYPGSTWTAGQNWRPVLELE
jgi:hypothetical protein